MVREQLSSRKTLCGCFHFRWLWVLISIMKSCLERCALQLYQTLKDKNDYKSCVIYNGDCSCGSRYIGETKRNVEVRWNEHNNPTKCSELSKHLRTSTTTLQGLSFQMLQKMLRPGRT